MLQAGIVGLPNVGKSTLFNALTRTRKAEAQNYPFCTIEPNVGVVTVPDERLAPLAELVSTTKIVPAAVEMVDIAGLVAGASKGDGLGNQFLANIREVDAIVQVVRCFEDADVVHTMGEIDPVRDIETIETELILADLQSLASQETKVQKKARGGDKDAAKSLTLIQRLIPFLNEGKAAFQLPLEEGEDSLLPHLNLLSSKPVLYACNVADTDLADANSLNSVKAVKNYAEQRGGAGVCIISAQTEAELIDFEPDEAREFLAELGVRDSGVGLLIRSTYELLGLASFLTAGEPEVRAWTFRKGMKAPQCAGVIHTDFEKGFIKAEVVTYSDLVEAGSLQGARDAGKFRLEGKEYEVVDGDVVHFRFA
ncbi:MAG: redox-regulated ATPase YchF [Verrucomicrobiota bacterium]